MAADTATVTISDADGNTVFTKSALTVGSTSVLLLDANNTPLQVPLSGAHTITLTTANNVDTATPISIALLIDA